MEKPPGSVPLVLGVDPGTRILGFAVLLPGARPRMREFGAIRLRPSDPLPVRLRQIHRELGEVIARHRPAVVALEDIFHGKNFRSAVKIGEARGVALLCAALSGLPVVEYAPAVVKKAVTGNGRADKRQVQRMVTRLLGLPEVPRSLDAADALAIALCHARRVWRGALLERAEDGKGPRGPGTLQAAIDSLKRSRKSASERRVTMSATGKSTANKKAKSKSKPKGGQKAEKTSAVREKKRVKEGEEPEVLLQTRMDDLRLVGRGKVRDLYDLGERLLVVATDRISAFDVVLPDGVPDKGKVLTRLSVFWLETLGVENHLVTADLKQMPRVLAPFAGQLRDRAMLVRRLKVFPIECVARGYLAGAGWNEYRERGSVCGVPLPRGLVESDRLPEPIFTPTTKAQSGHDEPLTFAQVEELVGEARAAELRDRTLEVYRDAARLALGRGIIICDTKLEWGIPIGSAAADPEAAPAILADEVLTPDSSRFWPQAEYRPGRPQPSFDKQYVRDYLLTLKWDRKPPGPRLPAEVIAKTAEKYREIYRRLTGREWS